MFAPTVFAANYCVIRDDLGRVGVTNGVPTSGWYVVSPSSCFVTADAAERDSGTGKGFLFRAYDGAPPVDPRGAGQAFMAEKLP